MNNVLGFYPVKGDIFHNNQIFRTMNIQFDNLHFHLLRSLKNVNNEKKVEGEIVHY